LMSRYNKEVNSRPSRPRACAATGRVFERSALVVAIALLRADYRCEVPGCQHPVFVCVDGTRYSEVHHIVPLASTGAQTCCPTSPASARRTTVKRTSARGARDVTEAFGQPVDLSELSLAASTRHDAKIVFRSGSRPATQRDKVCSGPALAVLRRCHQQQYRPPARLPLFVEPS